MIFYPEKAFTVCESSESCESPVSMRVPAIAKACETLRILASSPSARAVIRSVSQLFVWPANPVFMRVFAGFAAFARGVCVFVWSWPSTRTAMRGWSPARYLKLGQEVCSFGLQFDHMGRSPWGNHKGICQRRGVGVFWGNLGGIQGEYARQKAKKSPHCYCGLAL